MKDIDDMPPKCHDCPYWEMCDEPYICPTQDKKEFKGGVMKYKKQPYCCAECCYSRFLKFPKPLCIITNREFTHQTAKSKAEWCPIKDGKTIDDFRT